MAGLLKKTTGLTGLAVSKHPHQTLRVLYNKLLSVCQKMPENAGYRRNLETLVKQRLDVVQSEPSVEQLEAKMQMGQVEEVILQAERELKLARHMLQWKPWEPLVEQAPPTQWKWPL